MNRKWSVVLSLTWIGGMPAALADCPGDAVTYELDVYFDSNGSQGQGDAINYEIYLKDGVDYEASVPYLSLWWNNKISAIETAGNYPAHWWLYDSSECGTLLEEDDGNRSDLSTSGDNDQTESVKFRCPANKDRTAFRFCLNADCSGDDSPYQSFGLYKHGNSDGVVIEMPRLDGHWNEEISAIETNRNGASGMHYHWYFYVNENYNDGGDADLVLTDGDDDYSLGSLNDAITSFRLVISDSETPPAINAAPMFPWPWNAPLVPALSGWGVVALLLALATGGTLVMKSRGSLASADPDCVHSS